MEKFMHALHSMSSVTPAAPAQEPKIMFDILQVQGAELQEYLDDVNSLYRAYEVYPAYCNIGPTTPTHFNKLMGKEDSIMFIAKHNGTVIGCCVGYPFAQETSLPARHEALFKDPNLSRECIDQIFHIKDVLIHEKYRNLGVGSSLLQKLVNHAKNKGFTKASVAVTVRDEAFYDTYPHFNRDDLKQNPAGLFIKHNFTKCHDDCNFQSKWHLTGVDEAVDNRKEFWINNNL
jgi:ribosomal protein S18 acetylase RimI-like enzyme